MVDSLFFEHPILNSPYEYPARHWELDAQGQPTQRVVEKRRTAEFNDDSVLELTPDLVGPSVTKNAGIIGQDVDLSLEHLEDMRRSTLLFHVTHRLLYTKWRDPGEEPKLHLIVEIKGYRREDAKEKKAAIENYWIPGMNNHEGYGRWAFAEFTGVYQIESGFEARLESEFDKMVAPLVGEAV